MVSTKVAMVVPAVRVMFKMASLVMESMPKKDANSEAYKSAWKHSFISCVA